MFNMIIIKYIFRKRKMKWLWVLYVQFVGNLIVNVTAATPVLTVNTCSERVAKLIL
jgi:hypothetical protein